MTTYIDFQPSDQTPPQFQAMLDGAQYNITCTWNMFGERYYINIYDTQGNLVVSRPMVSSPQNYDISLTDGYFTTKLIFRGANMQFEVI